MKRSHLFDVDLERFFALFLEHILQEFPDESMKEGIEGSQYKKHLAGFTNQSSQVLVTIQTYKPNEQLSLQTTNDKEVFTSHYRFRAVGKKTELEYEERYSTNEFLRGMNHTIMKFILRKRVIRSIEDKFIAMEHLIRESF